MAKQSVKQQGFKKHSALLVNAFITHAVLSVNSKGQVENSLIYNIFVTDTIQNFI
ncbi:hypothetical protein AAGW17_02005 [Rickettsia sp. Oklahoma-10]|uniref:Transposase n=1 Tax=Rickettsia oklahomensis TaxID=3141789 RepID=A0AAU7BZV3_9RICK